MEWVAIDVHIAGDAVTHRLADQFRLRVAEAAGLLTLAFAGMAQHAQEGSLSEITDSQIEAWCFWHGKRGAFAQFFRAQLCDEAGTVRAWDTYNGAHIREANAARERMQAYRAKKKAERSQNGTANGSGNGTGHVRHNMTGQDRTSKKQKPSAGAETRPSEPEDRPPLEVLPKALCDAAYEAWIARIGAVEYSRFRKALLPVYRSALSAHPSEAELVASIETVAEAREADSPKFRGKYTVEHWASGLHEYVRLGTMPLMDTWGEPTERGRIAGLGVGA